MRNPLDPKEAPGLSCEGPSWSGRCPFGEDGGPVACAGQELLVERGDGGRFAFSVRPGAPSCPLIALGPDAARKTWIIGRRPLGAGHEGRNGNGRAALQR